jgi:CRISPR-associated protein Csx17
MSNRAHEIALPGCSPTPLAGYLKALGILRLVSEQADGNARGWWQDDLFHLTCSRDVDGLLSFFLYEYRPTPLVAPWNGGSGFYPKDNQRGIGPMQASQADRLSHYAGVIGSCRGLLAQRDLHSAPKGDQKAELLTACRNALPDHVVAWLDAAYVLAQRAPRYPPLLGTGGNDGRLEFTNNFMQRLLDVIDPETGEPTAGSSAWLQGALFDVCVNGLLEDEPIGQFLPGAAGGANASADFDGDSLTNPWEYILMLEGALAFSASVTRRIGDVGTPTLSYPFTVRSTEAGYTTAPLTAKGSQGDMRAFRAEMWLPIWQRPATYQEVHALFSEGRAAVGRRGARDGVDFARAVGTLGVDRGITAFERFGYLQRNGQAYIAVPLDRWPVPERPRENLSLLDEVDRWLGSLGRVSRQETTPASFGRAVRRIRAAIMNVCRHDTPGHWQAVIVALGAAEAALVGSPKTTVDSNLSPLPSLGVGWLRACDDESVEFRLALSLASIRGEDEVGPLRANMVPLRAGTRWPQFSTDNMDHPFVVWRHADLCANMTAVLMRRCMEAQRLNLEALPLRGTRPARLDDVSAFIYGEVDERRLEELVWGLNAVWLDSERESADARGALPASFSLLKLVHLPHPLRRAPGEEPVPVRHDPEITRLACAGRMSEATRLAARRLMGSGLPPAVQTVPETPELSRRIAAALLFPLSEQAVQRLTKQVLLPATEGSLAT